MEKEIAIGILHDWCKFLNGVSLDIARGWVGVFVLFVRSGIHFF